MTSLSFSTWSNWPRLITMLLGIFFSAYRWPVYFCLHTHTLPN